MHEWSIQAQAMTVSNAEIPLKKSVTHSALLSKFVHVNNGELVPQAGGLASALAIIA